MEEDWDRKLTNELTALGIPWEQARTVVGIVAEHRQRAYLQGYNKGYNDGYARVDTATTNERGAT